MATRLSRRDTTAHWCGSLGHNDPGARQQRISELRDQIARGTYRVNLEELAAAIVRRGALMQGAVRRPN